MADFTALKTAIQTYIKQNGNEEITGEKLQEILLSMVTTLGDSAINDLVTALNDEVAARQNADGTLQQNITNEATARGNADTALGGRIDDEATARANGDTALANRLGSTITAENTAADQIGAEAEARAAADTALQDLIDGITENIENGYVYAGIATPSSTPATGKVFYLALTAGTYTNFGSTVVSQGINILKYNGSAWSLDAFISIDDVPTPSSTGIPKSGGTFDFVMKNGSAFDISAHFASGGTLATYADLSAALAALDTLTAAYKRGGMVIRYVDSSDNKYVQYRLMANSFSTTVSDWQGVDDEPTAGSENLVKSEGIASINGLYNTFASKYNTNGSTLEIKETVNYSVRQIEIEASEGDNFRVFGYGGISERLWACIDINNNILSKSESYANRIEYGENFVCPQNTVKVIFSCYLTRKDEFFVIKNGVIKHLSDTIVSLKDITDILVSGLTWEENDTPNIQNNKAYTIVLGEAPSIATVSHYCCAKVENLRTGDVININGRTGTSYVGIAKVLNGVVTEIYKDKNTTFSNISLTCDGTYDSVYINDYTFYTALTVSVVYKFTLKEKIQEQQTAITNNRNDIDELKELQVITLTKQATTESNNPYVLSVGSAPSQTSASSYTSCKIEDLRTGDKVVLSGNSGSSYVGVALVKNGIVTSIDVAANTAYNKTIICDGTFDSIYANSYNYYAELSATITLYRTVKEITTEQIGQITELRTDVDTLRARKNLRILCIGNSFTQDSMGYVPFIFKNLCPDINLTLGIAYIGGSCLAQHCAYFCNETIEIDGKRYYVEDDTYKTYDISEGEVTWSGRYTFYISEDSQPWTSSTRKISSFINLREWDIITFQQSGSQSIKDFDLYYAPFIFKLQCSVLGMVTHPMNFGWISIHGSYGGGDTDFYNKWVATTENSEKIMKKTATKFIFPYGTAIQNLRTTPLKDLGDGTHHNLTADNAHIQDGIGCLCAAYSCTLALMKLLGKDTDSIFFEQTEPTEQWLTDNNVPGVNLGTSGVIGITAANDKVAQAAAISSIKLPYELTDMSAYYTNMV